MGAHQCLEFRDVGRTTDIHAPRGRPHLGVPRRKVKPAASVDAQPVENINKSGVKPVIYLLTIRASLDHNVLAMVLKKQNIVNQII